MMHVQVDAISNYDCWVCGKPAIWHFMGHKDGKPGIYVEFFSCGKCAPFEAESTEAVITGPEIASIPEAHE